MDAKWNMREDNRRARVTATKSALGKMKLACLVDDNVMDPWASFFLQSLSARVAEGTTVEELVLALEMPEA